MRITAGLKAPLRLAIDNQDVVYVTDAVGGRICKYDSSGAFLGEIITGGAPLAIAVTADHRLFVGDRHSGELQIWDTTGRFIKTVADDSAHFGLLSSLALDDDQRLYAVDSKKKVVRCFDAGGKYLGSFGAGILNFPTGIAFDSKNQQIWVAEHGGLLTGNRNLIHAFSKQGAWLSSFGDYGSAKGQISRIQGLTVDAVGQIYLTDTFQGTVMVFKENGARFTIVGQFGTQPGELRAPMSVALDSRHRLWVASMNNASLEVYGGQNLSTHVDDAPAVELPHAFELLQNYPNPFNPGTWIPFALGKDSEVTIHIYDQMGRRLRTFELGKRQPGWYVTEGKAVFWDGKDEHGRALATGLYFYEIHAADFVATRRMLLLK